MKKILGDLPIFFVSSLLPCSEEIAINDLSPSEEYKSVSALLHASTSMVSFMTSVLLSFFFFLFLKLVLAGLRPEVIMEICSRALAFAAYQSYQERNYLENLCRKFEEKVQLQEKSLQQTVLQATNEITSKSDPSSLGTPAR